MKKIFLLFAAILFGVTASFAQVDIVNVSWNADNCFSGNCGNEATDFFKVSVSIYDNANSEWVVQNKTITLYNLDLTYANVDVPEVDTYCDKDHDYTPSLTVYAWVWLMDSSTNPPSACCSGSGNYSSYNCHDFYNGIIQLSPSIVLN
ncbi:MAG TPA: hypothetical protein VIN10_08265 [Bacteroidales bacterium]